MAQTRSSKKKQRSDLDAILGVIRNDITDAVDFIDSEFANDFETADRYYNGETDLPIVAGRSSVVATQVRDSIRSLKPSIMRVLLANKTRLVRYATETRADLPLMEAQTAHVHKLFWQNNGYMVLYSAVDESLRHKFGPVKTYWEEAPAPEYVHATMVSESDLMSLQSQMDVEILSVSEVEYGSHSPAVGNEVVVYDVEFVRHRMNGRIVMEAIPYGEFFISKNASTVGGARVHGHRRSVTVGEAVEMGLDFDDWWSLNDLDPQDEEVAGVYQAKRGYGRDKEAERGDVISHRFLLTEAYVYADLEGLGYTQLYCVYLGGTGYELLHFQQETESPFDLFNHDIMAFSPIGYSISDVTADMQDVLTSMLRGMVDNVHATNNPRFAGNPQFVNFDDLMNHSISHPIRLKGQGTSVQALTIPSQTQSTLPLLQWLEQDAQNKVGVTKAAQGLDPNAMQSTDKDAVRNTIMLAQGQIELMVRNLIETGLTGVFRKLLRLSMTHTEPLQPVIVRGAQMTVDQTFFRPDVYAEPLVGLGSASDERQIAGLQQTLQIQMGVIDKLGVNNPMVSISNIYNTLEDLTRSFGLENVDRYYNLVTPQVEAQFAEQRRKEAIEAEKANKPIDPAQALYASEKVKADVSAFNSLVKARTDTLKLQLDALQANADDDFRRDQLAQDRDIEALSLLGKTGAALDKEALKREQDAARGMLGGDRPSPLPKTTAPAMPQQLDAPSFPNGGEPTRMNGGAV